MNAPIHAPPRPRMFMQPIVGTKRSSYSAKLVFFMIPGEIRTSKRRGQRRVTNPSLLELRTFHVRW
jgi:hypothetical protein